MAKKIKYDLVIYHSGNKVSYDQLSTALLYKRHNFKVIFFTPVVRGKFHDLLDSHEIPHCGIVKETKQNTRMLIFSQFFILIGIISRHSPKIVISHLPLNNLISGLVSIMFRKRVNFLMVRHHTDYILKGGNTNAKTIDCLVNKLSPRIQAISDRSYNHLNKIEKVRINKILRLNLYFDFSLLPQPDISEVGRIQSANNGKKIILSIGRLIPVKNHLMLVDVMNEMKKIMSSSSFVLFILGEGSEYEKLYNKIKYKNLENEVKLLGYTENVVDYIQASDLIIHLSESENSLAVAKEAAIFETTFMGYKSVGDSNEFLSEETGFPLSKNLNEKKIAHKIEAALKDTSGISKAKKMKNVVIKKYSGVELENQYLELI